MLSIFLFQVFRRYRVRTDLLWIFFFFEKCIFLRRYLLKRTFLDMGQCVNLIMPGWCPVDNAGMHNRTNKLIEFQHNHRLPHWIINIFLTYNWSKRKLSVTYTKTAIVSTHPISHIVASMTALWPLRLGPLTLLYPPLTVPFASCLFSSLAGVWFSPCWYIFTDDPARRLLSVWNYISPKFAGVFDMTFNTTGEDDQDWTNKW